MNLTYWKSDIGNFGDDLNPWLWEKIFGDFTHYNSEYDFMGIGSMLHDNIKNLDRKKIIFGAGARSFLFRPQFALGTDICFVRGPISSRILGNSKYITDAAYCLALLDDKNLPEKIYETSYMPYFRQVNTFNWKLFEKLSGIKIILPTEPIDDILLKIKQSKKLITAAMHGAIVADVYRVPWCRSKFSDVLGEHTITSELKWYDWHSSLEMEQIPTIHFGFNLNYKNKNYIQDIIKLLIMFSKFRNAPYALSEDSIFYNKIDQLRIEIENIKSKYKTI